MRRGAGILVHITSLPSPYGVGDLGPASFDFIDLLAQSGQSYWQVLPTNPTGSSGCPYSSYSAFGGFSLLISPDSLVAIELLHSDQLNQFHVLENPSKVDFFKAITNKDKILRLAYANFLQTTHLNQAFHDFLEQEVAWVHDLAYFEVLSKEYGENWNQWPIDLRNRSPEALAKFKASNNDKINYRLFLQFIFFYQWSALKFHANQKKIQLIGDLPIFLSYYSVDAWKDPLNFKLDDSNQMLIESGAAPDAFSLIGQKWSTPNYNWTKHKKEQFSFWVKRFEQIHNMFDIIRIDHFRGFCHIWESYTTSKTAEYGWWAQTPGEELFTTLRKHFPDFPIIAEDLGDITPDVIKLRDKFNFPGMKILQFAFGSGPNNEHLPEFYNDNCVVYTATHDCDTTQGYFNSLPDNYERKYVEHYLRINNFENIHWEIIRSAMLSKAKLALVQLQDILGLGKEARFNMPGTVSENNWSWRATSNQLDPKYFDHLKQLTIEGIRHGAN
jgi:4-alpha-glucanotransferase